MATIITKNSSTASAVPAAGSLVQGELAVNVTDKKLYTKDSGGTVQKLVGSLGNQEANAVAITGGSIAGITDLAVADGGTGASTATEALNNLLPSQASASGKYLKSDGTNALWDQLDVSTADITGTLPVVNGGTGVTTSTGTGSVVLSNSPTLVTPALGTPSSATLTNATGLPISTGVSGLGTGIATALAVNVGTAGAPVVNGGALGTPSSGTVTNLTGTASININGTVGATTPTTGAFTTLSASSDVTISGGTANGVAYLNGSKVLTTGAGLTYNGSTLATTGALTVSGNTTLGDASTDTVTVTGYMGVGGAANSRSAIEIGVSSLSGSAQYGIVSNVVGTSAATATIASYRSTPSTAAASFSVGNVIGHWAQDATKGAGSTITNQHGLYIADQTQGTNNYGITSLVSSGTNKWNIYASGTANNYFAGNVGIGTSSPTGKLDVTGSVGTVRVETTGNKISFTRNGANYISAAGGASASISYDAPVHYFNSGDGATTRMTLNDSGNLGLGVIPDNWSAIVAFQVGNGASLHGFGVDEATLSGNTYYNGGYKYAASSYATQYQQQTGQHKWFTAPSGTAGNAISFTQALTLTAAQNLLLGGTSDPTSAAKCIVIYNGTAPTGNVAGGILYVESGALKYRGSSGTVTTLAAA